MRRVAALALGVALLASGCGGKAARSAAEIAPVNARAFISLPPEQEQPLTRRALTFDGSTRHVQAVLDRAGWSRAAGQRVELAELADGRLVAYARLNDAKQLDAAHLFHARVRGWTVFAPTKAAVEAARTKAHLVDAAWYGPAAQAAGTRGTTFIEPGWMAIAAEGGTVRWTRPVRGTDVAHPLAADIPPDALAVAVSHGGARLVSALPFAADVQRVLGLRLGDLARALPGDGVLYVRPGFPIPNVTLLAQGGSLAAARRVVRELAPTGQPAVPDDVNGLSLEHVAAGAVDLYYGRVHGTLVVTNDAQVRLGGRHLDVSGLPERTESWFYVDASGARAALEALTALSGTSTFARSFEQRFAGLSSFLAYTTHTGGTEASTVVLR